MRKLPDRVLAANEKVSGRLMFSIFLRSRAGEPFKELGEERRIFKSQRMGYLLYEHIRNYFGVKVTKGSRFPVYGEQPVEQGVRLSFDNIHGEIGYYFLTVEG